MNKLIIILCCLFTVVAYANEDTPIQPQSINYKVNTNLGKVNLLIEADDVSNFIRKITSISVKIEKNEIAVPPEALKKLDYVFMDTWKISIGSHFNGPSYLCLLVETRPKDNSNNKENNRKYQIIVTSKGYESITLLTPTKNKIIYETLHENKLK